MVHVFYDSTRDIYSNITTATKDTAASQQEKAQQQESACVFQSPRTFFLHIFIYKDLCQTETFFNFKDIQSRRYAIIFYKNNVSHELLLLCVSTMQRMV